MSTPKLTAKLVQQIFTECQKNATLQNSILVKGTKIGETRFNPDIVNRRKNIIKSLISQLEYVNIPLSFANLLITKDGTFWTAFHNDMDKLVSLGIAAGILEHYPLQGRYQQYFIAKSFQNHL